MYLLKSFIAGLQHRNIQTARLNVFLLSVTMSCLAFSQAPDEHSSLETNFETPAEPDPILNIATDTSSQDLARMRKQLVELESSANAYDLGIGELALDIGSILLQQQNTEAALIEYRRALHISRVNHGLDSLHQLPVLEAIYEAEMATNQPLSAIEMLHRIRGLYEKNHSEDIPARVDVLYRIGVWHLSAYQHSINTRRSPLFHLLEANEALSEAQALSLNKISYNFNLYSLLSMTKHGLSQYVDPRNDREAQELERFPASFRQASNAYRQGVILLDEGIREAAKNDSFEILTRALLLSGDWYQLYGKKNSARLMYIHAYNAAQDLPEDHQLRTAFNQPHQLPMFDSDVDLHFAPAPSETEPVLIHVDVTEWGVSRNAQAFLSEEQKQSGISSRIPRTALNSIRSSIYRPAIIDGQPIDSVDVNQTIIVNL